MPFNRSKSSKATTVFKTPTAPSWEYNDEELKTFIDTCDVKNVFRIIIPYYGGEAVAGEILQMQHDNSCQIIMPSISEGNPKERNVFVVPNDDASEEDVNSALRIWLG